MTLRPGEASLRELYPWSELKCCSAGLVSSVRQRIHCALGIRMPRAVDYWLVGSSDRHPNTLGTWVNEGPMTPTDLYLVVSLLRWQRKRSESLGRHRRVSKVLWEILVEPSVSTLFNSPPPGQLLPNSKGWGHWFWMDRVLHSSCQCSCL